MASKIQTCIDKLSIKRDNVFSKMIHSKFDASHTAKIANLCQILYGELPIVASKNANVEAEEQMFRDLVYLWFNDNSVIEELHKLFKLSGLCFLHTIRFSFYEDMKSHSIWIHKHSGKSKVKNSTFDQAKYIKSEIQNCKEKVMAIPIGFDFNRTVSHANVLFIKLGERNKNGKIIVELERFDPHGALYKNDMLKSYYVNGLVETLGNMLFPSQHYEIKPLIQPVDHCPKLNISGLQGLTNNSAYEGSCTTFVILYSILKSINPERAQSEIADDIHKILLKHNNPTMIVRLIINVLTGMLNIKKEGQEYYILRHNGEKRKLATDQGMIVNKWIEDVKTNVVTHNGNKYEGKFENGLFVEGTITFAETASELRKTYTGKINKDTIQLNDPEGDLIWKDGKRYKGSFIDGKMTGKGVLHLRAANQRYEGDFVNGMMTGKGKYYFKSGNIYEGDFTEDDMTGKGIMRFANGHVYKGDFYKDDMTGKGIMRYANGDVYEGDWIADKMTGKGAMRFKNKDFYEGDFVDGKQTGKGIYYFEDGNVYDGDWLEDEMSGKGKYYFKNGNVYEGDFDKDDMTGKGIMRYDNGDVYEGDWIADKMTGKGIMRYQNGNVYEGDWKDNQMNGKGILRYQNGDVYEGEFIKGIFKKTSIKKTSPTKNTTQKSPTKKTTQKSPTKNTTQKSSSESSPSSPSSDKKTRSKSRKSSR